MIIPVQKDLELVQDFNSADNVTGALHVWWLGHSGFLLKWKGVVIVIDPYLSDSMALQYKGRGRGWPRMTERVVDPLLLSGVDILISTQNHLSHLDPETILGLRSASPNMKMVIPAGIQPSVEALLGKAGPHLIPVDAGNFVDFGDLEIHGITAANPEVQRDSRGHSMSLGYVLTMGPFAIYHSGDTLWHKSLVKEVRRWNLNLAMLPISGYRPEEGPGPSANLNGFEASALAKGVSAGLAVPCHYDMFREDSAPADEFIYCCDRLDQRYRILQPGLRLTMGPMKDPGAGKALPSEAHRRDWDLGY